MGEFDYDLTDPNAGAAPKPRRAAAPAATGLDDATLERYLADPTAIPTAGSGASPAQKQRLVEAWPILGRNTSPEGGGETARVDKVSARLDRLLSLGEAIYGGKADKATSKAVAEHFDWLKEKDRRASSEHNVLETLTGGPGKDPLDKLKGPARTRALAMVNLLGELRDTKEGGANTSPYELLTTHLPSPKDSPEDTAKKRAAFASEVEALAQGFPSQYWRPAIKHILRARNLAGVSGPTSQNVAPKAAPVAGPVGEVSGQTSQNQAAPAAAESEGMGTWEAIKRSFVQGASNLSIPAMAALAHATSQMGIDEANTNLAASGQGPVDARAPTFDEGVAYGKQKRADLLGDPNAETTAEKHAEAGEKLGTVGQFAAEFAGGMVDPTMYMLGPLTKAIGMAPKLSPAAAALLGHTVGGGAAGGLGAAGEGQSTVRGVLVGMGMGAVLGKLTDKVLNSPATSDVIEGIVKRFGSETKAGTAEVAAKRAAVTDAALGSADAREVAAGSSVAAEKLGPQLIDRRNALLAEHKVPAGSRLAEKIGEIEDAIDAQDSKAIEKLRTELSDLRPVKKLRKDLDELFGLREIVAERLGSAHGHGAVSQSAANLHPFATLSNSEAGMGAKGAALLHAAGEGQGARGAVAFVAGNVRNLMSGPVRTAKQGLAKLYLARQTGDQKLIHMAAEEAIRVGAPFSLVTQISTSPFAMGGDEE